MQDTLEMHGTCKWENELIVVGAVSFWWQDGSENHSTYFWKVDASHAW